MKTPETIFLIEQEGRLTFAVTRPTSPTITDDQVTEYVKAGAKKPELLATKSKPLTLKQTYPNFD
ncbi:hypothetical protein [Neptunomonas phycophila]|uniref:hypothetical protein n=1 Tax=Neptunomonas phycophila TaxID=1572645 RepID=UPI0037365875